MAATKIKVGDKITVSKEYCDIFPKEFTPGVEYEVTAILNNGDYEVMNDSGADGAVEHDSATRVAKKRTARKKVAVPDTKIEEHHIVGQDENKKILKEAIKLDLPVLLIGETGTGKTSIIREQAIEQKKDIVRFSITGETTVDEFVGKYELDNGKTVWKDGILLDAMKKGKWLVCDEVNVALPEILFVLHSLLDDDKSVTVSNHLGEVVKPHADFRFFATMNPPEEYAGTKELNKAFQSRFTVVLILTYPDPAIEAKIISDKTGIDITDATKMADVAAALRKAKADEKIFYTCSTRDLLHWGTMAKVLDPSDAFRVAILNKTGTDEQAVREVANHIIKRYFALEDPAVELSIEFFEKEAQKLIKERKDWEAEKENQRKLITQEIIQKLTSPEPAPVAIAEKVEDKPDVIEPKLDDIFASNEKVPF